MGLACYLLLITRLAVLATLLLVALQPFLRAMLDYLRLRSCLRTAALILVFALYAMIVPFKNVFNYIFSKMSIFSSVFSVCLSGRIGSNQESAM